MAIDPRYQADFAAILSHRHDQGADFWTTPDRRLIKGTPFSAHNAATMLLELGLTPDDPLLAELIGLFFAAWREDGRFKLYPTGGILPCHTTNALSLLCHLGQADDPRLQISFAHLLETQQADGGWRCNKFSFGRGPETAYSNPMPTLTALDAFRFRADYQQLRALDQAVEFLLEHWRIREPIGPCHYGIGTLFMQVEYPLRDYNLFTYVHVLSFYAQARKDPRFLEALAALEAKTVDGQIVVERVVPKLAKLSFCKKGQPSELATRRYRQILTNLGKET